MNATTTVMTSNAADNCNYSAIGRQIWWPCVCPVIITQLVTLRYLAATEIRTLVTECCYINN